MPLLTYAIHHTQFDDQESAPFDSRNLYRTHITLRTGDQETNPLVGPISELLNDEDTKYFFTDTQPDQSSAEGIYLVKPSDTKAWELFIVTHKEQKSFPLHCIDGLEEELTLYQLNTVNQEEIKTHFKESKEAVFNYTIKKFLASTFPDEVIQNKLLNAIKLHVISDRSIFFSSLGLLNFFFDLSIIDFYQEQAYCRGKEKSPYSIFTIVNSSSNPEIEITRDKKLSYEQGQTTHTPATLSVSCRIGIDPTSNEAYIKFLHRELRIDNTTFIRKMKPLFNYDLTTPPLVAATFPNAKEDRAYPKFDFTSVLPRDQMRILYKLIDSLNECPEDEKIILHVENSTELTDKILNEILTAVKTKELEVSLINCSQLTDTAIQAFLISKAHHDTRFTFMNDTEKTSEDITKKTETSLRELSLFSSTASASTTCWQMENR